MQVTRVDAHTHVIRWTDRRVFDSALQGAFRLHPVVHDNGNQVVFKVRQGELTMIRQEMVEEIRYS